MMHIIEPTEESGVHLSPWQKSLIEAIKNDKIDVIKNLLPRAKFDYVDEHGMTPLQHASYRGQKEIVQMMLDLGADINFSKHGSKYTSLHFAALSGNTEVCRILLDAGINPNAVNSISRTAAQLGAFVGNHACVDTINNYVPQNVLEHYIAPHGQQTESLIPPELFKGFHRFVIATNLHPVRVALNLMAYGLSKNLPGLKRALELLCEKEMTKIHNVNELLALKYHYLYWIVTQLLIIQEQRKQTPSIAASRAAAEEKTKAADSEAGAAATAKDRRESIVEKNHDFIELFIKRVLKENKQGDLDYLEYLVREAVRSFKYWDCSIFRQISHELASKDSLPALTVLRNTINGHRRFAYENLCCSTCGNEKPDKKCSKCKVVQYCDRACQRLHWSVHKKTCTRPTSVASTSAASASTSTATATTDKPPVDVNELREELTKLTTS